MCPFPARGVNTGAWTCDCLTRKNVSGITICSNKYAIGFSNHTHSPVTTHHQKWACTPGVSVSIMLSLPASSCDPTKLCLCWSHPVKTVREELVFCGATRYNSRPGQDCHATRNRKTGRDAHHTPPDRQKSPIESPLLPADGASTAGHCAALARWSFEGGTQSWGQCCRSGGASGGVESRGMRCWSLAGLL